MDDYVQVMTTTDSEQEAGRLAEAVVEARLAACVQVSTVRSTYWWEGKVERADEYLLTMKTRRGLFEPLAAFVAERHSYDTPEITAVPIVAGSEGYLRWIAAETG